MTKTQGHPQTQARNKPPLSNFGRHNHSNASLHASEIKIGRQGPRFTRDNSTGSINRGSIDRNRGSDENKVVKNVSVDPKDVIVESAIVDLELLRLDHVNYYEEKFKEAIYVGQMAKDSERHGLGVMKYSNGR
jgi:hypothetical protein